MEIRLQGVFMWFRGVAARVNSAIRPAELQSRVPPGSIQVPDPSRAPQLARCFCAYIAHYAWQRLLFLLVFPGLAV